MMSNSLNPINLGKWIAENRHLLKPPIGNRQIWEGDHDFFVNIIAGPNQRIDYHIDEGEEFFYQIEGDMTLRVIDNGIRRDLSIREGEIFLLPPRVPHSPQRPAGTLGLVIERRRAPDEKDSFVWYCENCGGKIHALEFHLAEFDQIRAAISAFYADREARTCPKCKSVLEVPPSVPA
jgi:3-hydroxyanthranilate 3,4-dioxygenase